MFNKIYVFIKKFIKENFIGLIIIGIVAFLGFYKTNYVIYSPGSSIDLNKRVTVENGYEADGSIRMAFVSLREGTLMNVLVSKLFPNWDLIDRNEVVYEKYDLDTTFKIDRLELQESIANATFVAYNKAGKDVQIKKETSTVVLVLEEAQTDVKLFDHIKSVDNKTIEHSSDVKKIVSTHEYGDELEIVVERDGKEKVCRAKVFDFEGSKIIGLSVISEYELETDPDVNVSVKSSESGPSGGLMLSLAIYNELVRDDITHGKMIIGSGTIDKNGKVGKIGGVKYKLIGAEKNHADVFLCCDGNYDEAVKVKNELNLNIEVVKVNTFEEALSYLESLD